jgi:hypothetical protein
LRREFCCKPLNSLADWARKSAQEARILQNSLFFSLLAGNFEVETGSIRAASPATQWVSMHPFCLGLATTSARAALRLKAGRQPYASARQARTTFLESSLSLQRQPASAITADHHCESQLDPLSLLLFHKAEKVWRDFREPAVPSGN